MEASCCVDRKIFLSPASASSRARTLASRPTMNGVICCGKMTISRTGIIGTRLISCFSRLNIKAPEIQVPAISSGRGRKKAGSTVLVHQTPIDFTSAHHVRGDNEVPHFALQGQVGHDLHHEVFV